MSVSRGPNGGGFGRGRIVYRGVSGSGPGRYDSGGFRSFADGANGQAMDANTPPPLAISVK